MTQTSVASSSAERPLFRYDLQTTAFEESGRRYVDVTDPDGGKSFRFYEVEYAVACGMDGQRDVPGIVRWAMLELDLQTTTAEVGAIVAKLAELNYIDGAAAAVAAPVAEAQAAESAPLPARQGMEFELGDSGKSNIGPGRPGMPNDAADVELGLAGRSDTVADSPPKSSIDSEFELGVAGNEGVMPVDEVSAEIQPEAAVVEAAVVEAIVDAPATDEIAGPSKSVSTDLSQTFRVNKGEVQEAVRASKLMSAVDVPADLAAELGGAEQATPEHIDESSDISASIAEDAQDETGPDAIALEDSPESDAQLAADAGKEEELAQRAAAPRPIVGRSASIALWLVLLATVAGGAYYYYTKYVQEPPVSQTKSAPIVRTEPAPEPAPEPGPSSVMKLTEAPTAAARSPRAGIVAWVVDHGSEVSEGDAILKIRGFERYERALDKQKESLERYRSRLETALARDSSSKIPGLEANVARKETDVAAAHAKLDAYLVKAPIDGVVEVLVEARAKLKAEQAIGKVVGPVGAVATFILPDGLFASLDEELEIVATDDAELKATCVVVETQGAEIKVSCPSDSGIEAEAAIQLVVE